MSRVKGSLVLTGGKMLTTWLVVNFFFIEMFFFSKNIFDVFKNKNLKVSNYIWLFWRKKSLYSACSRHRARLEAEGRLDVTLHCARNGNYEKLQCDSGVCWCADPKTGVTLPGTRVVPRGLWNLLPCCKEFLLHIPTVFIKYTK